MTQQSVSNIVAPKTIHVITLRKDGDDELNAAIHRAQRSLLKGECSGYKILSKKTGEVLASWLIGAK